MNVLLAEANMPYDEVFELEDTSNAFAQAGVAFVAGTAMFIGRSLASSYAGIGNALFCRGNTAMLSSDAKMMTEEIVKRV